MNHRASSCFLLMALAGTGCASEAASDVEAADAQLSTAKVLARGSVQRVSPDQRRVLVDEKIATGSRMRLVDLPTGKTLLTASADSIVAAAGADAISAYQPRFEASRYGFFLSTRGPNGAVVDWYSWDGVRLGTVSLPSLFPTVSIVRGGASAIIGGQNKTYRLGQDGRATELEGTDNHWFLKTDGSGKYQVAGNDLTETTFSPDGKASGAVTRTVHLSQPVHSFGALNEVWRMPFVPTLRGYLAFAAETSENAPGLVVVDPATGATVLGPTGVADPESIDIVDDRLYYAEIQKSPASVEIKRWEPMTKTTTVLFRGTGETLTRSGLSDDGKYIVYHLTSNNGHGSSIVLVPRSSSSAVTQLTSTLSESVLSPMCDYAFATLACVTRTNGSLVVDVMALASGVKTTTPLPPGGSNVVSGSVGFGRAEFDESSFVAIASPSKVIVQTSLELYFVDGSTARRIDEVLTPRGHGIFQWDVVGSTLLYQEKVAIGQPSFSSDDPGNLRFWSIGTTLPR